MTSVFECSGCGFTIDLDEMGMIQLTEIPPNGSGYETEIVYFHGYKCVQIYIN